MGVLSLMAEIRGEKVDFNRRDIVPLHEMPSAQVEDPIIVHCPPARSRAGRIGKPIVLFLMLIVMAIGSAILAIEGGAVDGALSTRAQAALNNAIGPRYVATVGSTLIRFDSHFRIAIEARDVDIVEQASGEHLSKAGAMRLAIDPLALLSGRISINHIEADDIRLETAQLPQGDPVGLSEVRVDAVPNLLEQAFQRLDEARDLINRTGTGSVRIAGIDIVLPAAPGQQPLTLSVDTLRLGRNTDGEIAINGIISLNGRKATVTAASQTVAGVTSGLTARLSGLETTPFLLRNGDDGAPREGLIGSIDFDLSAVRARENVQPTITATVHHSAGKYYNDGIEQPFNGADIHVAYNFARNSIEILKSQAQFGATILPLTGAIVDLNQLNPDDKRPGFGLDLLISGGTAVGADGEPPAAFDLKAVGRYLSADRELQFDQMSVSSPLGQMAGSLKVRFGNQSPEISFGAQIPKMAVTGVKQLWPFWMARKPRDWVGLNMFGGTITNGSIAVFIPAGRMKGPGIPMELDANELRLSFDMADTRLNMPGDVPPLRDIYGHLDLKGERLQVDISRADSFFPSGRTVQIGPTRFSIASTYTKPLMADIALKVSGNADAVTELANFRPIRALNGTDMTPDQFSGTAQADITARMGLISDQKPPKPVWVAHVQLADVGLSKKIEGRQISHVNGTLDVDPQAARLNAKGAIDDVPAEIALVQPVDSSSNVKRSLDIKATLNDDQREKLVPGLSDMVQGTVGVELTRLDDNRQGLALDLTRSTLSVPWIGWTKGGGIGAKAQFELSANGAQTDIRNFSLSGDGFGAKGNISLAGGSLSSADFSSVQLTPADNYSVNIKHSKNAYDISVGGGTVDIRPVITKLRSGIGGGSKGGGSSSDSDTGTVTLRAKLDKMLGFNDEALNGVNLLFQMRSGHVSSVDLSASTTSGQAVVSKMIQGDTISLTSGDAGAIVRFANLYSSLRSGLLNLRLKADGSNWAGALDVRNFSLVNDQKLETLVSTPVGKDGESINSATKKSIDVSSAKFQRAYATLAYRDGALSVDNGIVRGEQIGASFQGMVRDASGRMELTGTFMPAYGLNRLFGELPIIGAILGNGRDRGLLGITFKLEGPFDKPKLQINPLSIIAPGVFRQIFEFQ